MNYLLLLILVSIPAFGADCMIDPKANHPAESSVQEINLNQDALPDLKIMTGEKCGAKGCEGVIYIQESKACYKLVLSYQGVFKILPAKIKKYHQVQVGKKIYQFNLLKQKYEILVH